MRVPKGHKFESAEFKDGKPSIIKYRPMSEDEKKREERENWGRVKAAVGIALFFALVTVGILMIAPDPAWHPKTLKDFVMDFLIAFAFYGAINMYFLRPRQERVPFMR